MRLSVYLTRLVYYLFYCNKYKTIGNRQRHAIKKVLEKISIKRNVVDSKRGPYIQLITGYRVPLYASQTENNFGKRIIY